VIGKYKNKTNDWSRYSHVKKGIEEFNAVGKTTTVTLLLYNTVLEGFSKRMSKPVKVPKVTPESLWKVTLWSSSPGVNLGSLKRFILRYLQQVIKSSTNTQSKYVLCDYGAVSGEHQIGVVVLGVVAVVFGFLEKIHHQVHLALRRYGGKFCDDFFVIMNLEGVVFRIDECREAILGEDQDVDGLEKKF
jgi:hypothetical protein